MDTGDWAVVAAIAAGVGALGALVSSLAGYKSIRLTQRQQQTAMIVARLERSVVVRFNGPAEAYLVIENRGPAVARNLAATVRPFVEGQPLDVVIWSDDTENDDGSMTITVEALGPGASCWRGTAVGLGSESFRVIVELKWHDDSGARSDRHIVELV